MPDQQAGLLAGSSASRDPDPRRQPKRSGPDPFLRQRLLPPCMARAASCRTQAAAC